MKTQYIYISLSKTCSWARKYTMESKRGFLLCL